MFCDDCGKRISKEEFIENDRLCMVCFDELIDEVMDDETETDQDK